MVNRVIIVPKQASLIQQTLQNHLFVNKQLLKPNAYNNNPQNPFWYATKTFILLKVICWQQIL